MLWDAPGRAAGEPLTRSAAPVPSPIGPGGSASYPGRASQQLVLAEVLVTRRPSVGGPTRATCAQGEPQVRRCRPALTLWMNAGARVNSADPVRDANRIPGPEPCRQSRSGDSGETTAAISSAISRIP